MTRRRARPGNFRERISTLWEKAGVHVVAAVFGAVAGVAATYVVNPPSCVPQALFRADVTFPDGSLVKAGQRFEKQWLLENPPGRKRCSWGSGYNVVWVGGENLAQEASFDIGPAAPGQEVRIAVPMVGPSEAGDYESKWILRDPDGELFGDPFWARITVE